MTDLPGRDEALLIADKPGGHLLLTDLGEMSGVGTVVATDDEQEIERSVKQFLEGILTLLSRAADGVKESEIRVVAIARDHGLAKHPLHRLGLLPKHGGLIGHADADKMQVRVETL